MTITPPLPYCRKGRQNLFVVRLLNDNMSKTLHILVVLSVLIGKSTQSVTHCKPDELCASFL